MRITLSAIVAIASLLGLTIALPSQPVRFAKREVTAADAILAIAPTSNSCANEPAQGECVTNVDAAPHLINAMVANGLYQYGQIAAVIANMAFETSDFKYNINHNPGRPGQGTRNMQLIKYNVMYARSKDELKDKVPEGDADAMSDDDKNKVLNMLRVPEYDYDTGAWFLKTQCDASVMDLLATNPDQGWAAFQTCCDVSGGERDAYWTRAKAAFGL